MSNIHQLLSKSSMNATRIPSNKCCWWFPEPLKIHALSLSMNMRYVFACVHIFLSTYYASSLSLTKMIFVVHIYYQYLHEAVLDKIDNLELQPLNEIKIVHFQTMCDIRAIKIIKILSLSLWIIKCHMHFASRWFLLFTIFAWIFLGKNSINRKLKIASLEWNWTMHFHTVCDIT